MLTSNLLTGSPSEGTGATILWYLPGVSSFHFSCLEKSILKWHKLFFVTVCLLLSSHFLCTQHQCETCVAGTLRNVFAKSLGPCDTKTPPSMLSCSTAFCLFYYLLFNGIFNPPLSDRICLNNAYTFLSSVFIVRSRIYKNIWLKKESKNIFILNRFSLVIYLCGSLINAFSSC